MLAFGLATQYAHAQSSVILYGIADTGIRFQTNQATKTGSANNWFLSDGAVTGSRWGVSGQEDLGAGTSAIFGLESGFSLTNGTSGQQGQLFGRFAWVGLSNPLYGTVRMGRQYGIAFEFVAQFDPISVGNVGPNEWEAALIGARYDNTVTYANTFGPAAIKLQRSFGNQAGSAVEGSTTAGNLIFGNGPLKAGIFGQQSLDAHEHAMDAGGVGLSYQFNKAVIDTYYFETRRDAGFTPSPSNSGLALANTSMIGNYYTAAGPGTQSTPRTDHLVQLGGTYTVRPTLLLTLAGLFDWTTNVAPGKSGKSGSIYGIADYYLSKRTDVYLEADYSHLSGASVNDPNSPMGTFGGKSSSIGTMVGLRTRF
ncbi:porin [Paraburkholderia pallida]|uniref:Porin n=2 Tax=Paraburkholderia pallida TaxID=2547399 RepID=A0A4P7DAT5_9BURK|nr:porin [Paraburkholderia pallida]